MMGNKKFLIGKFCAEGKTITKCIFFFLSNNRASPTKWQQYIDKIQTIQYGMKKNVIYTSIEKCNLYFNTNILKSSYNKRQ